MWIWWRRWRGWWSREALVQMPLQLAEVKVVAKGLGIMCTILWLQQTVRLSCSSSMYNGIKLEPPKKRFNSAYLQIKYFFVEKFTVLHFD